jgi:hypothetical protein
MAFRDLNRLYVESKRQSERSKPPATQRKQPVSVQHDTHLLLYAGFALLSCPPQVPRLVLGLGIMLNGLFFILVLCVLAFALLEWLFRPTQPTPSERNKPSESSAEEKARAARAGGRDS